MSMETTATVTCPYCFERVEIFVDPETEGTFVEDCEICCRPWRVTAYREAEGLDVTVERAS